jgi:hypothetical protein
MRPLDNREQRKSTGIANVRMCLKTYLGWMDGFPVSQSHGQLQWQMRPKVGDTATRTVSLNRDTLRRAKTGLTRLTTQLADATCKVVGDLENWQERVSNLLETLKVIIHEDDNRLNEVPLECLDRAEIQNVMELIRRSPQLRELLSAIIWSQWACPERRAMLLAWVARHASLIASYAESGDVQKRLQTLLMMADLSLFESSEDFETFQRLLFNASTLDVTSACFSHEALTFVFSLKNWKKGQTQPTVPALPAGDFDSAMSSFLDWLIRQESAVRQLAFRMVVLTFRLPALQNWRESWSTFHKQATSTVDRLRSQITWLPADAFHLEACRIAEELRELLNLCGPTIITSDVLNSIRTVLLNRSAHFCNALCEFAASIPEFTSTGVWQEDGCILRIATVCEAAEQFRSDESESRWTQFYQLAAKLLKHHDSERQLVPWSGLIACQRRNGYLHSSLRADLFYDVDDEKNWPAFFECLRVLIEHPNYSANCTDIIAWLLNESSSVEQTCFRFAQIASLPWLQDCSRSQIVAALKFDVDGYAFPEMLKLIGPESKISTEQITGIMNLYQHFRQAGWSDVVPMLLRTRRVTEITQLSMLLGIATAFAERPDVEPRAAEAGVPSWAANLPVELLPSIACLCALPGVKPRKAKSILASSFPDATALQSEIAALENRSSNDPAEKFRIKRLENLRQRLSHPEKVSPAVVERLKRKLHEAACRQVFHILLQRVLASIEQFLHARIGGQRVCRELSVPRQLELVSCLLRLHEPYRDFGLRLLRKCWGDTDWDQTKEPANERFLETLESRGIQVAPWLQNRSVRIEAAGHRHPLTISFSPNEVETMLMGYYFGTCLSPGNVNFFSAVANAVDINKRVVFARTATGQVVGRCLLALGDSGTLMTFHPYCNEETFPFSDHMATFAAQIAEDMGTVVSHNDTVGILVAPEWYNDGACDLGNSVFRDESPLRIAIRAASEDDIVQVTEQALGTVGLNDTMLEMLVELPEFKSRPQLIVPFVPHFERRELQLGVSSMLRAALLAFEAGERSFASRVLLKYGPSYIKQHQTNSGFMREAVELLKAIVTMHPSVALRLLRETRHRSIRSDAEETNESRRELLADCFTALARPKLAAALRT